MNTIIKPTLILAMVAFVAALMLSHVKKITYPNIVRQEKEKQSNALLLVLPGFKVGEEQTVTVDGKEFHYWIGEKEENRVIVKGYAFITASPGYSGDVKSMAGVDEKGTILGLSILQQSETPGLGARSTEITTKKTLLGIFSGTNSSAIDSTKPWFQEQFEGLNINNKLKIIKRGDWSPSLKEELMRQNAISAITGATITSRATVRGVEEGFLLLQKAIKISSGNASAAATVREVISK